MADNWVAVAMAINGRMAELGRKQREVIERSGLARQTVREVQHNRIQRHRSPHTLAAISRAVDWHPDHLAAVLNGRTPPELGEPSVRSADDIAGRLDAIEYRLNEIAENARSVKAVETRLSGLADELTATLERVLRGLGRRLR